MEQLRVLLQIRDTRILQRQSCRLRCTKCFIISTVSLDVSSPLMSSTTGTLGTGLRKCIPIILSGRDVASAIFDKLNVDVFEKQR